MASFALLNEEKKILRRKEKELERQQKINEIKAAPVPVHMGKWADASDDEDLNVRASISDSETESEPADAPEAAPVQDWEQRETNGTKADTKEQAAPSGGKNKKEAKKPVKPDDEDLDAILGELGIDLPQESQGGASSSKKNRKKKDKEAETGEPTGGYPDAAKEEKAKPAKAKEEEKKTSKEKEENGDNGEEKVLDEVAKQAALEALKKKKAAAGKKAAPSDAVKAAAAEAKKRAEQKKTKKDKSMYDR